MSKVTKEMIEYWLGTDTDIPELLSELANGEYTAEEFNQDVIDTWQHGGVVREIVMLKPNDCTSCGEDTSFGSGRFVNRIPADDTYMCAECQMVECDMCDEKTLEYHVTLDGEWICDDCKPKCNPNIFEENEYE